MNNAKKYACIHTNTWRDGNGTDVSVDFRLPSISGGTLDETLATREWMKASVRFGMMPSMTTGTIRSSTGWYISETKTITFSPAFATPPAVMFQENGGNAERYYRYRLIAFSASTISFCLVANTASYTPTAGTYIAIGY